LETNKSQTKIYDHFNKLTITSQTIDGKVSLSLNTKENADYDEKNCNNIINFLYVKKYFIVEMLLRDTELQQSFFKQLKHDEIVFFLKVIF
jgi:hypothetical protein